MGNNGLPLRLVCRKISDSPETWQVTLHQNGRETFTAYAGERDDALRQAWRHMLAVVDFVADGEAVTA